MRHFVRASILVGDRKAKYVNKGILTEVRHGAVNLSNFAAFRADNWFAFNRAILKSRCSADQPS